MVSFRLIDGELGFLEWLGLHIEESLDRHSTLVLRLTVKEEVPLHTWLGAEVDWQDSGSEDARKGRFLGRVVEVECDPAASPGGRMVKLTARGTSFSRDLHPSTRSFSAGLEPCAITDLEGMEGLLRGVERSELLQGLHHHLLQWRETDWSFLRHLANRQGLALLSTPEGIAFTDLSASTTVHVLEEKEIVESDQQLQLRAGGITPHFAWCWSAETGRIPESHGAAGQLERPPGVLFGDVLDRSEVIDTEPGTLFGEPFDPSLSPELLANLPTRREAGASLVWTGTLRERTDVKVGDCLQLPKGHAVDSPLVVTRRSISVLPPDNSSRVRVVCQVAGTGPRSTGALFEAKRPGPQVVTGRVTETKDGGGLGRVRVAFPWSAHLPSTSDSSGNSGWKGTWCQVPQSFGGIDDQGRVRGTAHLPEVNDWVRVIVDLHSAAPPVVLGAVYRGNSRLSSEVDPAQRRVLLETAGGLSLVAAESEGALTLQARDGEGKVKASLSLGLDGKASLHGANQVELSGKKLRIEGQTTHDGDFEVV